jgi:hypothetical protein
VKIISFGLVLSLFLQRPAALGQNVAAIGLICVIALTATYALLNPRAMRLHTTLSRDFAMLAALVCAYLAYETVIAISFGLTDLVVFTKEFVITLVVLVCYGFFLARVENNHVFFRQFTTVVSLLGWSSFTTFVLMLFVDWESLELFTITINSYEGTSEGIQGGTVYLPFSMLSNIFTGQEIPLPRFNGFFREPGIYQAVAAFCVVLASLAGRSFWIQLGLALGILCTFSPLGVATLIAAWGITFFLKRPSFGRFVAVLAFLSVGAAAALYTPIIGLSDKFETHATSITDRTIATERGLDAFAENPLGDGLARSREENDGITLLAGIGSIGLLGFLLQVMVLSGFRLQFSRNELLRIGCCAPILVTALFSQPIYGAAMMYVLVMVFIGSGASPQPPRL